MSLVRVQNVTMRYDDRILLREVSLKLGERERVGLVGGNGSGKTTLLRLILGLETPTEGTVDVTLGTEIGYFSQHSELAGDLSLQQILEELFADVRALEASLDAIAARLETVVDTDELEHLLAQ